MIFIRRYICIPSTDAPLDCMEPKGIPVLTHIPVQLGMITVVSGPHPYKGHYSGLDNGWRTSHENRDARQPSLHTTNVIRKKEEICYDFCDCLNTKYWCTGGLVYNTFSGNDQCGCCGDLSCDACSDMCSDCL